MSELLEIYWPLIVAALALGLIVAWYLFHASRRTHVGGATRDVLDEGATPAERNKALMESTPSTVPVEPTTEIPATASTKGDDLTRIKGLGPKLATTLHSMGVTTYGQIASWDDNEIDRIDAQLGRFRGRIRRDDWVGQANLLAVDDEAGFKGKYGNVR